MIRTLLVCIFVLGGNAFLNRMAEARGFEIPYQGLMPFFLAAGVILYLATHEGGHRTVGAALGWTCVRFGVGPYEFFRDGKGWKKQRVKMLWGAFVRQAPSSFAHFRRDKAMTLLGGPTSSLVFGLVFLAIAIGSPDALVFASFSKFGLFTLLGVMELIPFEKNGIGSDGYRLRQVLEGGHGLDEMQRDIMAEASNFTRVRYREWPHDLLVRAVDDDPYGIYLAYLHSLDSGDTQAAGQYMRKLIPLLPEEKPHPHFACEAAFWLARYGGDAEEARKWLGRTAKDIDAEVRLRAESAIALAEGQPEAAERLANEALALMKTLLSCGSRDCEADLLRQVLNAAASGNGGQFFAPAAG